MGKPGVNNIVFPGKRYKELFQKYKKCIDCNISWDKFVVIPKF